MLNWLVLLLKRIFTRRNFWIYVTIVLLLILLPLNKSGSLNHITVIRIRGDYFFHALTFLPWAFFGLALHRNWGWWLLTGLLFSTGTECLQYLLPYRRFNINDLLSNSTGIILGMVIFLALRNGLKQRQTTT